MPLQLLFINNIATSFRLDSLAYYVLDLTSLLLFYHIISNVSSNLDLIFSYYLSLEVHLTNLSSPLNTLVHALLLKHY